MNFGSITSLGLWLGIALTVLAWIKVIPLLFGWFGFAIALPSFIVEAINKKNVASSSTDDSSEGRPEN